MLSVTARGRSVTAAAVAGVVAVDGAAGAAVAGEAAEGAAAGEGAGWEWAGDPHRGCLPAWDQGCLVSRYTS